MAGSAEPDPLAALMLEAADGICDVQTYLDQETLHAGRIPFSIPSVTVNATFALTQVVSNRWLVVFERIKDRRLRTHNVTFGIVATPDPPGSAAGRPPAQFDLVKPAFLVPGSRYRSLLSTLISTLSDKEARRFRLPSRSPDRPEDEETLEEELEGEIDDERDRLCELQDDEEDPDRGMAFAAIDSDHPMTLAVRIDKHAGEDGVFLLHHTEPMAVEILSIPGDGHDHVDFAPFQALAETIRSGAVRQEHTGGPADGVTPGFGLAALDTFVNQLREAWVRTRERLRAHAAAVSADPWVELGTRLPSYYRLTAVDASLSYTIRKNGQEFEGFEFSEVDADDAGSVEDGYDLLSSRANVRLSEDANGAEQFSVELIVPNFVMTSGALRDFVDIVAKPTNLETIMEAFPAGQVTEGTRMSLGSGDPSGVVVFLTYDEDDHPTNRFLVVWAGAQAGRDLVFTCVVEEERIRDVRPVAADPGERRSLDKDAYKAFHNFFHAIRIWTVKAAALSG